MPPDNPLLKQLDYLLSQLNQTGLNRSNTALWEFLRAIIAVIRSIAKSIAGLVDASSSGNSDLKNRTYLTATQESAYLPFSRELIAGTGVTFDDTVANERTINSSGADGMVPFFIASGDTFTVPEFKQALFAIPIDNEGSLIVDGALVWVD